ncbi:MAG TPA: pyridoxamine 5'-phosphate oxidase family protein [Gaiellaceae bacterium]|jgi:nitroimidazol reductase NimA-like FMN-containing flavoprotein (pyridoxamine 5'-phosphate oxidase superfamily)
MIAVENLLRVQKASFAGADKALRGSWAPDRAMGAEELESFLNEHTFCVLATTTGVGRPQARPVAFTVLGDSFWFATVAGGRLRNIERMAWVSVVISEGDGEQHRMVAVDGPVTVVPAAPDEVVEVWERRIGSRPRWAAAWFELRPERLYSYTRA